ncbi:helix-turn-helix transcriptional regulator [Streptomyces sp. AJS327]|nr:helix-turn-helix transcriptional regulator [Streptomyces sp. AJS327]
MPDLRQAVRLLGERGDNDRLLGLLTALAEPLLSHGLGEEAADDIERTTAAPGMGGVPAAEALMSVGCWALNRGETERAERVLDRATELTVGEPGAAARVSGLTGELLRRRGEMDTAATWLESAIKELDTLDDPYGAALARRSLALVRVARGDATAEEPLQRALNELPGRPAGAPGQAGRAVPLIRADLLIALGRVRRELGRTREAYDTVREAMRLLLTVGGPADVAEALETVATVAGAEAADEQRAVARCLAAAEALRRRYGLISDDLTAVRTLDQRLREGMDSAALRQLRAEAQQSGLRDALIVGLFARPPVTREVAPRAAEWLTPRQREIALLVADGLTNRQIARQLSISEWTVVNHLRVVMQKLECTSRVHVVRAMQGAVP